MTRHRLDLFSLLSGLTLTGIALVALLGVGLDVAAWVWPTILIGVGVVVLATVLGSDRTATDTTTAAEDPSDPARDEAMAAARAEVDEADRGASPSDPAARDGTSD